MAKNLIKEVRALKETAVGFGSTVELSSDDVAALQTAKAKGKVANDAPSVSPAEPEPEKNGSSDSQQDPKAEGGLTLEQVEQAIAAALQANDEKHAQELDELRQSLEAQLEAEKQAAEEQRQELESERDNYKTVINVMGLNKMKGREAPANPVDGETKQSLEVLGTGSHESRQFLKLVQSSPVKVVTAKRFSQAMQRDTRGSDAYFRKHKQAIAEGVEAELREAGFLNGGAVTNAITVASDIPSVSFEYLSASIRETHFPDLIHWQFANTQLELGTVPGLVMAVARYDDITPPTAVSDFTLASGTPLTPDSQNISEKNVTVEIQELGLGKDTSNAPVGVSTFINAYSINDLEMIIVGKLGRHYQQSKDLYLRTQWFATDRIVYNDAGQVTTTPSDIATGDDGTMTEEFLIALRAYMKILKIPTYRDGCYGISMNEYALAQFMQSKSSKERDQALSNEDLVTMMLAQSTLQDFGGEVTG